MAVAGDRQVPVGQLLGRSSSRPTAWPRILSWRNWKIPTKLMAALAVPALVASVLAVLAIVDHNEHAANAARVQRLVALDTQIDQALTDLGQERTRTAVLLAQGVSGTSAELGQARTALDASLPALSAAADEAVGADASLVDGYRSVNDQLAKLAGIRERVSGGQVGPVESINEYSTITTALLNWSTAIAAEMSGAELGLTPTAGQALRVVNDEVAFNHALVGYGIARASLIPSELAQINAAEVRRSDRLAEFFSIANQGQRDDFQRTVTGLAAWESLVKSVLTAAPVSDTGNTGSTGSTAQDATSTALRNISAAQWNEVSAGVTSGMEAVAGRISQSMADTTSGLAASANRQTVLLVVLLLVALLVSVLVVFVIGRHLVRSLRALRDGARDVADRQLPLAVQSIREGRMNAAEVAPVLAKTDNEVGDLAQAFSAVHSQAIRLAVDQAAMRVGYGNVFVNLSRRSQSLVQRQLQLIERLEKVEEDPEQLGTLFQLDHLATRMRRNNENLMVLSGVESGRRVGQPVNLIDALRAAVSEIEQYQRVVMQQPPEVRVVGYAAGDLVRLLAELLDNATAFSPPDSEVTVASRLSNDGGLTIDVLDKGIGMKESEVAAANARLTEEGSVDLITSRRMGLFVVGRLANRHGIRVSLHGGKDIPGLRVAVTVPRNLVLKSTPTEAPPAAKNGVARPIPTESAPSELEISGTALFSPIKDPINTAADDSARPPVNGSAHPGALSDWWSAGEAVDADEPKSDDVVEEAVEEIDSTGEQTPIFDETVSAWFRAPEGHDTEAPVDASVATPGTESQAVASGWGAAAGDEGWRAAQAAAEATPANFTEAGLPKRQRGDQLLPGSMTPEAETGGVTAQTAEVAPHPPAVRDPAGIRSRLGSFQRGVRKGREARATSEPAGQSETRPDQPTQPATPEPNGLTTAGLPRRRRGEQLLPGSAGPLLAPAAPRKRDAHDVRGRLSSFQQGVRRGRHAAPATNIDNQKPEDE